MISPVQQLGYKLKSLFQSAVQYWWMIEFNAVSISDLLPPQSERSIARRHRGMVTIFKHLCGGQAKKKGGPMQWRKFVDLHTEKKGWKLSCHLNLIGLRTLMMRDLLDIFKVIRKPFLNIEKSPFDAHSICMFLSLRVGWCLMSMGGQWVVVRFRDSSWCHQPDDKNHSGFCFSDVFVLVA